LDNQKQDIKWAVRQRLEFLESQLFWKGQVSRRAIMNETGVSRAQASLDLTLYKEQAPNNLTYSLSEKTYYLSDNFIPLYIEIDPQNFLQSQPQELAEHIVLPLRKTNINHLRMLHKAIEDQFWVSIEYQSLSGRPKSTRTIAPHHYVSDGHRWHVRAYDFSVSEFRDFVLGRIIHTTKAAADEISEQHNWEQKNDGAWNEQIELLLTPHPGLTKDQRIIIEADYGMKNGEVSLKVRRACLVYVIAQMRLIDESPDPRVQQIILKNHDVIKEFFK
jgi:WYL domain